MAVVDDIRKLFQDLIAPELRSISVRLDEFEKRVDERFTAAEKRSDDRFAAAERQNADRFAAAEKQNVERFTALEKRMDDRFVAVDQRFVALEQRVVAVEEHVGAVERQIAHRFEVLDQRLWTNQTQTIGAIQQLSDYDRLTQRVMAIEERTNPQGQGSDH